MKHIYTIQASDIGRNWARFVSCSHCGTTELLSLGDLLGHVQPQDVGKRIFRSTIKNEFDGTDYHTDHIESNRQLEVRLMRLQNQPQTL